MKSWMNEHPLWTALVTPFNTDLSIDYASLESLIKRQTSAQNGLLVLGSTGESLSLTLDEKKQMLKFITETNPSVPIMVSVAGTDLQSQLEWMDYCQQWQVDAFLMVTPPYLKPGPKGQVKWFKTLLNHSKLPCMLYNIPSRCGVPLAHEVIEELAMHPNFWALKESSASLTTFSQYQSIPESKYIHCYCGDDGLAYDYIKQGAKGLVSVASNLWPVTSKRFVNACLNKTLTKNDRKVWHKTSQMLSLATNPIPAKALMAHKTLIGCKYLRLPLTTRDLATLEPLIAADKQMLEWEHEKAHA